jgi:hypothetical protein
MEITVLVENNQVIPLDSGIRNLSEFLGCVPFEIKERIELTISSADHRLIDAVRALVAPAAPVTISDLPAPDTEIENPTPEPAAEVEIEEKNAGRADGNPPAGDYRQRHPGWPPGHGRLQHQRSLECLSPLPAALHPPAQRSDLLRETRLPKSFHSRDAAQVAGKAQDQRFYGNGDHQ